MLNYWEIQECTQQVYVTALALEREPRVFSRGLSTYQIAGEGSIESVAFELSPEWCDGKAQRAGLHHRGSRMSCCRAGTGYGRLGGARDYLMSSRMIVGVGWKEAMGRMALLLFCDLGRGFHFYFYFLILIFKLKNFFVRTAWHVGS